MEPIGQEWQNLMKLIEKAGGLAGEGDPNTPDWIKRAFIDEIHSCPDCQEALHKVKKQS